MEQESIHDSGDDLLVQSILLAAAHHDLSILRNLLRTGSASVQDPDTGFSPLHAAIAACETSSDGLPPSGKASGNTVNGCDGTNGTLDRTNEETEESDIDTAADTLKMLLQNGAIWNDIDKDNETPGCLALRLGLDKLYEIMVDAGVRAEILLTRLDEYEQLRDRDDVDDADEVVAPEGEEAQLSAALGSSNVDTEIVTDDQTTVNAAGENDLHNEGYLLSNLHFQNDRILDDDGNGVMMAWETSIMKSTTELLCPKSNLSILNVGHGMGIIDRFFQDTHPTSHHIIEAHPAILARMRKDGWYERSNVVVHEGRWQDVVPKIIEEAILFDAIYFDTFAEDYKALRDFFSDCIIGLLEDGGKWGFFNGLGADRQICYDVYAKVVEMDLFEAGFDTVWETIDVPEMTQQEWEGVKRKYWTLKKYKLPICEFIG